MSRNVHSPVCYHIRPVETPEGTLAGVMYFCNTICHRRMCRAFAILLFLVFLTCRCEDDKLLILRATSQPFIKGLLQQPASYSYGGEKPASGLC